MQPIKRIASTLAVLNIDNIDTDQIIPARFLKRTTKTGLGVHAFNDWRYDAQGVPNADFPLNQAQYRGAAVLVAGANFGCGSSREHAPWALLDFGIQAVISTSIADIFRSNSLKNGLLPIEVDDGFHQRLLHGGSVVVDLEARTVTLPDGTSTSFAIDPFARYRLLNGIDELDFLLQQEASITAYEKSHP